MADVQKGISLCAYSAGIIGFAQECCVLATDCGVSLRDFVNPFMANAQVQEAVAEVLDLTAMAPVRCWVQVVGASSLILPGP